MVYEDPWLAGGHNGLSNVEDPRRARIAVPARARAPQADARGRPRPRADRDGRRRLASQGLEGLDRQPGARADRVPVRHPAAAHPREPDPRELEEAAARAAARRRAAAPLQPDRLLLVGGQEPLPRRPGRRGRSGRCRTPRQPIRRTGATRFFAYGRSGHGVYLTAEDHARVQGWLGARLHPADAHAGRHADLRRTAEGARDPPRPGRLHGLPQPLQVQQLEGSRRLHHRHARRPALVLHPEDAAGDRPRPRRAARRPADVRRPQCLPIPRGSVLRQRLHADGEAAGAAASSQGIDTRHLDGVD